MDIWWMCFRLNGQYRLKMADIYICFAVRIFWIQCMYIYIYMYIYKYRRIISRFKNKECSIQVTIAEHLLIINDLIQFFN